MVSQNTVQTGFTTTTKVGLHQNFALQSSCYSDETVAVSQNVFAVSKVKPKTLERSAVFCKHVICCQRKSKCSLLHGF